MDIQFDFEGGQVVMKIRATDDVEEGLLKSIEKKDGVVLRFGPTAILELADEIRKASAQA